MNYLHVLNHSKSADRGYPNKDDWILLITGMEFAKENITQLRNFSKSLTDVALWKQYIHAHENQ